MAEIGKQIKVIASFTYDDDTEDLLPGVLTDAASVTYILTDANNTEIASGAAYHDDIGIYSYTWTPTEAGIFTIVFSAEFAGGETATSTATIVVSVPIQGTHFLNNEIEIEFSSGFDPLYIDPESIAPFFPDVKLVDIAKQVYLSSLKVKKMLKLSDSITPPQIALDYIQASVACYLSRFNDGILSGASNVSGGFTLGDFSVQDSSGGSAGSRTNSGNAQTWCELAYALEMQMQNKTATFRPVVKANRYANPIPERRFPNRHGGRGRIPGSGRIDD